MNNHEVDALRARQHHEEMIREAQRAQMVRLARPARVKPRNLWPALKVVLLTIRRGFGKTASARRTARSRS